MKSPLTHILLLAVLLLALPQTATALLKQGETLPELTGQTAAEQPFSSNSLKGKKFILKLGTTWCGTCGTQSKEIEKLRDFLKERDIQYVDIFIQEDAQTVQKYFADKGLQLPDQIVLDDGKLARQLNVYLIPRVILVDKELNVIRDGANLSQTELKKLLTDAPAED